MSQSLLENLAYKRLTPEELWRSCERFPAVDYAEPRLAFYSSPPADYAVRHGIEALSFASGASSTETLARHGTPEQLDRYVKLLEFPAKDRYDPELSTRAAEECETLRQEGCLQAMRGGRGTDVLRPLPPALADRLTTGSPALVKLIRRLDEALEGSGLFLRSIKFDPARASSTSKSPDRRSTHLHLDAERASIPGFGGSIRQFYLNLSPTPRHFLIVPATLPEMIALLGDVDRDEPVGHILDRFLTRFGLVAETCSVPSWNLVIFDGRAFAHDAGKFTEGSFSGDGLLELAEEPDLVAALDAIETNYEHVGYDPTRPFLEDLAEA